VTDETAEVAADVERADLRALVRDALGGVGPTEREILELQLRQGLSGGEVASMLGISRNHDVQPEWRDGDRGNQLRRCR
jgi:DNA-directed RNA polymerase specialized sigma24 family protein